MSAPPALRGGPYLPRAFCSSLACSLWGASDHVCMQEQLLSVLEHVHGGHFGGKLQTYENNAQDLKSQGFRSGVHLDKPGHTAMPELSREGEDIIPWCTGAICI